MLMSKSRALRRSVAVYQILGGVSGIIGAAFEATAVLGGAPLAYVETVITTLVMGVALILAGVALLRHSWIVRGARLSALLQIAQVPIIVIPGVVMYWLYMPLRLAAVWENGSLGFLVDVGGAVRYMIGDAAVGPYMVGFNLTAAIAAAGALLLWRDGVEVNVGTASERIG